MIYARIHDQMVAEDYYAAMSQIEKSLKLIDEIPQGSELLGRNKYILLLQLTDRLEAPDLSFEERLRIVGQLREAWQVNHADLILI